MAPMDTLSRPLEKGPQGAFHIPGSPGPDFRRYLNRINATMEPMLG